MSPPPPTSTKTASSGSPCWRTISIAHRALAGDDVLVVEGRNEDHPALGREGSARSFAPSYVLAGQHHLRPEPLHRLHLDARRRLRHDDEGTNPEPARGERNPLRMIAGGRRDDPTRPLLAGERRELVVGASELEREYRLKVLALEPDLAAEPRGELRSKLQRGLARHVVDARLQDLGDVVSGHANRGRGRSAIAGDHSGCACPPASAASPERGPDRYHCRRMATLLSADRTDTRHPVTRRRRPGVGRTPCILPRTTQWACGRSSMADLRPGREGRLRAPADASRNGRLGALPVGTSRSRDEPGRQETRAVARAALEFVVPGELVGVGTGSTANAFVDALASVRGRIDGAVASSERPPRGSPDTGSAWSISTPPASFRSTWTAPTRPPGTAIS